MKAEATGRGRIDWKSERDRIDLAAVATGLLGPAQGRTGERGRRLWWCCPFHDDPNPSFCIEPGKLTWRCFGCDEHGDAASLMMRLERLTFPEAIARLTGNVSSPSKSSAHRRPPSGRPVVSVGPSGLPAAEALRLVEESEARLWSTEGTAALAELAARRLLLPETIRAARLGWTPGAWIPKNGGGYYSARGWVIPWFDGDRLALVKIRQPEGSRPKYAEAFRDRPGLYPGLHVIEIGRPLVIVEGEFDAMLLGQELEGMAGVGTLGSASGQVEGNLLANMLTAIPWYVATDGDAAGERAADRWPRRAIRVRPPGLFKDWTETRQGDVSLRRWWRWRLDGIEPPQLFTWDELTSWSGLDPEPGIVVDWPDPTRIVVEDDPEERAAIVEESILSRD